MAKYFILSVALFASLLAGEARSQGAAPTPLAKGTCAVLENTVSSAANHFERLRGDKITSNVYQAKVWISGFRSCSVVLAGVEMYACTRPARSETEARMLYQIAVEKTRACVPNWKEAAPFDAMVPELEMVEGLRFVETVDGGEISIGIAHARDKRSQTPGHSVSVVVIMRKKDGPTS